MPADGFGNAYQAAEAAQRLQDLTENERHAGSQDPKNCQKLHRVAKVGLAIVKFRDLSYFAGKVAVTVAQVGQTAVLPICRKRELKSCAWTVVGDRPEPAAMPINDGTTDC
jgi:hypothetical protein